MTDDRASLIGQKILGYELTETIGQGGMGTVFLGVHPRLEQRVAVKVLDPELARYEDLRERFVQEARIQIGLQHHNVVRVLTADIDGDHPALIMEYVEGQSLDRLLKERGGLPLEEARPLMEQILAAVGHAHRKGVVHRDLKPSNIMISPEGTAKVMDFGLAKVLGGAKLTRTGATMGTPHYMAPEQVLGRKDIDRRADIYSLGATFYELLVGRAPFESAEDQDSESDFLVKEAQVNRDPPDPRSAVPDLERGVGVALVRALQKEPSARFRSCEAFAEALRPPAAPTAGERSERSERPGRAGGGKRWLLRIVLVVALLVIIGVAFCGGFASPFIVAAGSYCYCAQDDEAGSTGAETSTPEPALSADEIRQPAAAPVPGVICVGSSGASLYPTPDSDSGAETLGILAPHDTVEFQGQTIDERYYRVVTEDGVEAFLAVADTGPCG